MYPETAAIIIQGIQHMENDDPPILLALGLWPFLKT